LRDEVPDFSKEVVAYPVEFPCPLHREGLLYVPVLSLPKLKETLKKSKEIACRDLNI
jgi:hypothetical protein